MDSTTIELKVTYGKDLKVSNYFQKPVVCVQVSIGSNDTDKELEENLQQVQRTKKVREEDGHPEWNQEMLFELTDAMVVDPAHFFLQFDLRHEGRMFGEKPIGDVRVPFSDLFEGSDGIFRYVSYEVRTVDGKPNGSLNFSYRVNFKGGNLGMGMNLPPAGGNFSGYPVGDYDQFSLPDPVQAYPAPSAYHEVGYPDQAPVEAYPAVQGVNVLAYPIAHEVGCSSLDPAQVYPPLRVDEAYPISHEVGNLVWVEAYPPPSVGHPPYPPPLNGCYLSPPAMVPVPPEEAVAIHHHHEPSSTHQWASDPHQYPSPPWTRR